MKKSISLLCLLLLFASCNPQPDSTTVTDDDEITQDDGGTGTTPPVDTEVPDDDNGTVDNGGTIDPTDDLYTASLFSADITFTNFDANDQIKVNKAITIIKKVIKTQQFKDRVLNFTYNSQKTFLNNNGMSNVQIYQALLDGSEEQVPGIDNQMDLDLELYYSSSSTVGYTYASGLRIWMNTKYFDAYTPAEVAGNIFHEWTHKLGFSHSSSYSVARNSSVPYALGYLMEELGKQYE